MHKIVTSMSELGPHCFGSESEIVQSMNLATCVPKADVRWVFVILITSLKTGELQSFDG